MLRVWLPPGYRDRAHRRRRYPVLYLNDGQDLFNACTADLGTKEWQVDETATHLIGTGAVPPLIIVGIDNAGRRERPIEYLPYPDDTLHPATPVVHGVDYPRFLIREVMPFINRRYRTLHEASATGIGGSSYGAGIALYTMMQEPRRFGRLLLESPSLYAHDDYLVHRAERFSAWPARIFIGVGTVNEPREDVARLKQVIETTSHGREQLCVLEQAGAAHNEDAWAQRFPFALEFLYGPGSSFAQACKQLPSTGSPQPTIN